MKKLRPAERDRRRQDLLHAAETATVREDVRATLEEAFTYLRCLPETEIDISYAEEADIAIRRLDLEDAGNNTSPETNPNVFFQPFDIDQLKEMNLDLRHKFSRGALDEQEWLWKRITVDDRDAEASLHGYLCQEFLYDRLWPDGEEVESLPQMCGWLRV
jgi:hypothetical protein